MGSIKINVEFLLDISDKENVNVKESTVFLVILSKLLFYSRWCRNGGEWTMEVMVERRKAATAIKL